MNRFSGVLRCRVGCLLALVILLATIGCVPSDKTERAQSNGWTDEEQRAAGLIGAEDVDLIKVVVAEPQQVHSGETVRILVRVDRPPGAGEIRLALQDLPMGIEFVGEESIVRRGERTHLLVLRATELAEGIVDAPVTLTATSEGYPPVRYVFLLTVVATRATLA
jgi:hypothetical protein